MPRWFRDRCPSRGIPSVALRHLLPEARFLGCRDLEVSGCSLDSRRIEPGEVYVAVGSVEDANTDAIRRALDRGAVGVILEHPCAEAGPIQIITADAHLAYARLQHALMGNPSQSVPVIAVAGSTRSLTAAYVRAILHASGQAVGSIGAHGWSDARQERPAGGEEPSAGTIAEMLAAMAETGCRRSVVEFSGEALRSRSQACLRIDVAIVSSVCSDGVSDAAAREAIRLDHARLMRSVEDGGLSIVDADDREAELLGATNLKTRRIAFGLSPTADVRGIVQRFGPEGTSLKIRGFGFQFPIRVAAPGGRAVTGALGAAAYGLARGLPVDAIVSGLESIDRCAGALERIDLGQPFEVFLDASRTGSALVGALRDVRSLVSGRVLGLLTASGDLCDDQSSLPLVETLADVLVASVGRGHHEHAEQAIERTLSRLSRPGRIRRILDRDRAISALIEMAKPGDAVLLTGGSGRTLRWIHSRPDPMDDARVAAQAIRRRLGEVRSLSA